MKPNMVKNASRLAAATLVAGSALVGAGVGSAQAASKDGVIETGEFVQWYFTGYSGGCEDDYYADSNFAGDTFKNCGQGTAGVGATVTNNTESDFNYDPTYTAVVYTGANFTGASGSVLPHRGGNYNSTFKNNVESLSWRL
jgi:hypothetical protein